MKDHYDFTKAVKNPHSDKLKHGYTVTVHYDFANENKQQADDGKHEVPEKNVAERQA